LSLWKRLSEQDKLSTSSSKLFYAFSKYPIDEWSTEIIFETDSKEELDEKEQYFIEYYDSINNGYNILKGGSGFKKDFLTESHKDNLSSARLDYYETEEGQEWKVKLSENFSGENNPMYGKGDLIREQNSKWYLLLDKADNQLIIKNLFEFRKIIKEN
jgi:hypothetical protein